MAIAYRFANVMNIEHIIFLIHPCCYEGLDAETVRKDNLYLYVELEEEVKARWQAALAARPAHTWFVQLGGPQYLWESAVKYLGEAAALYLCTPFPESEDLAEYYGCLEADLRDHIATHDLLIDEAAVTAELWGESFEGCVPGYGGAFAQYLGLQQAPQMRFEMTVYDSRFLYGARRWEVMPVPDSDVEAWLFECHDGTAAAIFQARRTAQWIDQRTLHLQLDDRRLQICTKLGHTLWPQEPWEKGKVEEVRPYHMTLAQCNWRWVRCVGIAFEDFRQVIGAARVSAGKI